MTDQETSLLDAIARLDDATIAEATQLFAGALGVDETSNRLDPDVVEHPMRRHADVVDLGRLTLMLGATTPEVQDLVAESIAGAGRKNLVFGGAEIVLIAGLAINALHMLVTKGRSDEIQQVTIEQRADGTTITTIANKVSYGVSPRLAELVSAALKTVVDDQ